MCKYPFLCYSMLQLQDVNSQIGIPQCFMSVVEGELPVGKDATELRLGALATMVVTLMDNGIFVAFNLLHELLFVVCLYKAHLIYCNQWFNILQMVIRYHLDRSVWRSVE